MDDFKIRITKEYTSEALGYMVWPGDVFNGLSGTAEQAVESGTEVKVAGEYIYVPATHFELFDGPRAGDRT